MDKNSIIGLFLIAGILIVYSIFTSPSEEEKAERQRLIDSISQVERQRAIEDAQREIDQTQTDVPQQNEETAVADSVKQIQRQQQFGSFAAAAEGDRQFITLENNLVKIKFSTLGGKPYSVELKEYKQYDGDPLILFTGDSTIFGLNFFAQNRSISTNDLYFTPVQATQNLTVGQGGEKNVAFRLYAGNNRYIEYIYTLAHDKYMLDFDMNFVGINDIIAQNQTELDFRWLMYSPSHERGRQNELSYTTIFYKHLNDDVENFSLRSNKDLEEESIKTNLKWVAFKQQFFSNVIISEEGFPYSDLVSETMPENSEYLKKFTADIGIPYNAAGGNVDLKLYFGPNHFNTLKEYEMDLKELVPLGGWIIKWINQYVIINIFNWLNNFIGNYGIIILLLTLIIKLALFPLTYKSYLSMAKMRVLKPQIDEINEKIPKEKAMERQQATMALYRKAGVNPMGGCLPTLLQMPILFAMFRFFPSSIELRQESFLWAEDLSTYDSIFNLPFTIPFYGDHVSLFTILMTASTILSMKMSNQTSTSASMPGMKTMMYIMPFTFMFILNGFSAGLTYYYFLANIITFGQNMVIKQFVDDEAILKKLNEKKKKPVKKSKFQARLEEAAKKKGYKMPKK